MPPTGVPTTPPTVDPACPSTTNHGTAAAYSYDRCRCPSATRAATRRKKQYRLDIERGNVHTVPSTGTVRRLRALVAIGWPKAQLAERLGVSLASVHQMMNDRARTTVRVAGLVDRLYRELADHRGPSNYAASKAAQLGYVPPIAWDDDTIDDPDAQPYAEWPAEGPDPAVLLRLWAHRHPRVVRKVDQVAFIREAHARGLTDPETARYLGMTGRHVQKIRSRNGIGSLR